MSYWKKLLKITKLCSLKWDWKEVLIDCCERSFPLIRSLTLESIDGPCESVSFSYVWECIITGPNGLTVRRFPLFCKLICYDCAIQICDGNSARGHRLSFLLRNRYTAFWDIFRLICSGFVVLLASWAIQTQFVPLHNRATLHNSSVVGFGFIFRAGRWEFEENRRAEGFSKLFEGT